MRGVIANIFYAVALIPLWFGVALVVVGGRIEGVPVRFETLGRNDSVDGGQQGGEQDGG